MSASVKNFYVDGSRLIPLGADMIRSNISSSFYTEGELHALVANNSDAILGVACICNKFTVYDGEGNRFQIDMLGYSVRDERIVIVEFKRDKDSGKVIQQIACYQDCLHRDPYIQNAIETMVAENIGTHARVRWDVIRGIAVARDFTSTHSENAAKKNNISLIRYSYFRKDNCLQVIYDASSCKRRVYSVMPRTNQYHPMFASRFLRNTETVEATIINTGTQGAIQFRVPSDPYLPVEQDKTVKVKLASGNVYSGKFHTTHSVSTAGNHYRKRFIGGDFRAVLQKEYPSSVRVLLREETPGVLSIISPASGSQRHTA